MTTIEEATKLLKMSEQAIWLKGLEKERKEAEEMAIKSLEAWEKVKEEIKQKSDLTYNILDEYPDEWYEGKCSAYDESLEIIEKYLAEASE